MEIKVVGSGRGKSHSTIGMIERFALASGVEIEIVKVENPDEIHRYGVHSTPAVFIGGKSFMRAAYRRTTKCWDV